MTVSKLYLNPSSMLMRKGGLTWMLIGIRTVGKVAFSDEASFTVKLMSLCNREWRKRNAREMFN